LVRPWPRARPPVTVASAYTELAPSRLHRRDLQTCPAHGRTGPAPDRDPRRPVRRGTALMSRYREARWSRTPGDHDADAPAVRGRGSSSARTSGPAQPVPRAIAHSGACLRVVAACQIGLIGVPRPVSAERPMAAQTAAVRASPQAGTSYAALGEASRPCDLGARKCQLSMASEGAQGTKAQLCPARHGVARARLPGRPGTVTVGDGLAGVTPGRVTPTRRAGRELTAGP